jgi:hypothetical protein
MQALQTPQQEEQVTKYSRSKIVQTAIKFGLIVPGWTLEDYIRHAAEEGKYATCVIWGEQSSGKSNRLLQQGFWVYRDWDKVLENLVFKPLELKAHLKSIKKGLRYPWVGWDDVGVHYTSNAFRTNIVEYEAIDSVWTSLRVKCSVVSLTIPNINRLARNLKDNVSHEVYLGQNQMEQVQRIVRLQSFNKLEAEVFKVLIEGPRPFKLFSVPRDVFKEYWERRLTLTEEALEIMDAAVGPEDTEGYLTILEAARIAKEQGIKYGTSSIQQDISRGVIRGTKIGTRLYVWEEDFKENLELKG